MPLFPWEQFPYEPPSPQVNAIYVDTYRLYCARWLRVARHFWKQDLYPYSKLPPRFSHDWRARIMAYLGYDWWMI